MIDATLCIGQDWPDASEGLCCIGAAVHGPEGCTCWEPVYDMEQAEPCADRADDLIRSSMCDDCAYRPGSPERTGHPDAKGDEALLDSIVERCEPFWCHRGSGAS